MQSVLLLHTRNTEIPTSWACCLILLHESAQRTHSLSYTIYMQCKFDGGVMQPVLLLHACNTKISTSWACCLILLHEHVCMQVKVLILLHAMQV
jgi:hypothetical protein